MATDPSPVGALPANINPYVGPRTFAREEAARFFGRQREARELLGLVISQRVVLFYAQSGAGKSSLLNTRLAPGLEEEGFAVLPVARVSGEVAPATGAVDNVFVFNLMQSIDRSAAPTQLAHLGLSDFLAGLTSDDGRQWRYLEGPGAAPSASAGDIAATATEWATPNTVAIIDQFEEIFTTHVDRWQEREGFFSALSDALETDPHLWVVLTLREDYVAALDPYASLMTDKLRARYYMERMSIEAALEAVRRPAELGRRPFAPGVAEELVDNLRKVRVPGQDEPRPGQYVEPVQLQVVCYQLWESLTGRPLGSIAREDLPLDYIDRALAQFYEDALRTALADPAVREAGVDERQLRTWFSRKLITPAGTRSTLFFDEAAGATDGLPNAAVRVLSRQFLLRSEPRAGGTWIELVHDRFVEPIVDSNRAWLGENDDPLTRAALAWEAAGRPRTMVFIGRRLDEAQAALLLRPGDFGPVERAFVDAGQRRESQMIGGGALIGVLVLLALIVLAANFRLSALRESQARIEAERSEKLALVRKGEAEAASTDAAEARETAEANLSVAQQALTVAAGALASQASLLESVLGTGTPSLPIIEPTSGDAPSPTSAGEQQTPEPTQISSPTNETTQQPGSSPTTRPVVPGRPTPARPRATATRTPTPRLPVVRPTQLDPKAAAQATDLAGVRARQTELASLPLQQGPIQQAISTPCPIDAGPSFEGVWTSYADAIGCATAAERTVGSSHEVFERGAMFWREDNDVHYVFIDGRPLSTFAYQDSPEQRPEYSCQAARLAGRPKFGFGRIWCQNANIRAAIGQATSDVVSAPRPVQPFERGVMLAIPESRHVVVVLDDGSWVVEQPASTQ